MLLQFLPLVLSVITSLVHAAEQAHPDKGSGAKKLEFVVQNAGPLIAKIPGIIEDFEHHDLVALIEDAVMLLNTAQTFAMQFSQPDVEKQVGS